MNNIYFANGHYGIQSAAQAYFFKSAAKLSLSQIAFCFCAIPNSPTRYDPLKIMMPRLKGVTKYYIRCLKQDASVMRIIIQH